MSFVIRSLQVASAANRANLRTEEVEGQPAVAGIRKFAAFARDDYLDAAAEARQERAAIAQFDGGLSLNDAETAAGIRPWNERETARLALRRARAQALGMPLDRAERIAARLIQRDRDADDRTLCIECSWARVSACAKRGPYLPDTPQRCEKFRKEPSL